MREDPKIAPNLDQVIGTAYGGGMTRNAWDYLHPLIEGQLSPTPKFRIEPFKLAYLRLEEFLYADTIQMQLFALYQGISRSNGQEHNWRDRRIYGYLSKFSNIQYFRLLL